MALVEKEKFLKIDEIIEKAKKAGVDFGKGDPKNRLRYYAKLGLLPPAKRKIFEGRLPTGAYPAWVLERLLEIDRKLKQGKTIQVIAKEIKEKRKKIPEKPLVTFHEVPPFPSIYPKKEKIEKFKEKKREEISFLKKIKPALFALGIFILQALGFLMIMTIFIFLGSFISEKKEKISGFLATIGLAPKKLIQEREKILAPKFIPPQAEPYFTINVETDINAPLHLKNQKGKSAELFFHQGDQKALLTLANLTAEREYILPDQSGTICLSTGNCFPPETLRVENQILNRLVKFGSNKIIKSSSILDLFEKGIAVTIDSLGNVGIGMQNPKTKLDIKGKLRISEKGKELIFENEEGFSSIKAFSLKLTSEKGLLVISSQGNIGIGKENPKYSLDVEGKIYATGDICTKKGGGKCLSQISTAPFFVGGGGGVQGSGNSNYLALWSSSNRLTSSNIFQSGENIGIGTTNPQATLDVAGKVKMTGFQLTTGAQSGYVLVSDESGVGTWQELSLLPPATTSQTLRYDGSSWVATSFLYNTGSSIGIGTTSPQSTLDVAGTIRTLGFQMPSGAQEGYILTSDAQGVASWQPAPSGTLPSGTLIGQTLYWDGSSWVPNANLFNDGNLVGIGTSSPSQKLTVAGSGLFEGTLTLSTSTTPQLVLDNDLGNYLNFSIGTSTVTLTASSTLILTSLAGQIDLGSEVTLFDGSGAEIRGATFISSATDSTVRKSGEKVFRSAIPVFAYSIPAQTNSTNYLRVSKYFSTSDSLSSLLPTQLPGTTRKYAFLLKIADDIPTNSTSDWRVWRVGAATTSCSFAILGQNLASLDEGNLFLSDWCPLPDNDWELQVKVPPGNTIRIFDIYLLVYDEIN